MNNGKVDETVEPAVASFIVRKFYELKSHC